MMNALCSNHRSLSPLLVNDFCHFGVIFSERVNIHEAVVILVFFLLGQVAGTIVDRLSTQECVTAVGKGVVDGWAVFKQRSCPESCQVA